MKNLFSILVIAVLCCAMQWFLPWWVIIFPCAFVGFFVGEKDGYKAFLRGFIGVFLVWISYALIRSLANDHLLANRMSLLIFKLKAPYLLMVVSAIIGGLTGGLAALSGFYIRLKL